MSRQAILKRPTEPIEILPERTVSGLLEDMMASGFQGRKMAETFQVWSKMLKKKNLVIWLGLAGAMVPAGMRKVISYLIRRRMIDVLVSTGANLYHDAYEAFGSKHYVEHNHVDDSRLRKHRIDRIYDVYADEMKFYKLDVWIEKEFCSRLLDDRPYSSREILFELGRALNERAKDRDSIIVSAYKAGVPIFSPALNDSSLGFSIMFANRRRGRRIMLNSLKDIDETAKIAEKARTGVIYIGGGTPKNFIQQTSVIASYSTRHDRTHEYGIQFTMDLPVWGGSSGCSFEESKSWGKFSRKAQTVTCHADSTIALPLVAQALAERFKRLKRNVPFFQWRSRGLEVKYQPTKL